MITWVEHHQGQPSVLTLTCATEKHPADWAVEAKRKLGLSVRLAIVFAMPITNEQHQAMVNEGF